VQPSGQRGAIGLWSREHVEELRGAGVTEGREDAGANGVLISRDAAR
jgi:hypothetical protein